MQTVTYWSEDRKLNRLVRLAGLLLLPAILYLLPLEWLKDQHSVCLFKLLTGHECYGCGITRAILSAIHFRFTDALHYNKLFLVVLPLLIFIWTKKVVNLWANPLTTYSGKLRETTE
jgi:hypothetical protein